MVISTINHSEIGVMFTNLAIYRRHGQGGIATDAMEKAEQAQEEVLEAVPWKHIMGTFKAYHGEYGT